MRKNLRCILPLFFLLPITGFSQLLQGRVLNESGSYVPGVTVQFQSKTEMVSTASDGTFKITATKLPDTLVFSSIGYKTYKVVISEKNLADPKFEIVLLTERKDLAEVVVVGYGLSKKADMTGSVSTLEDVAVSAPAHYIRSEKKATAGKPRALFRVDMSARETGGVDFGKSGWFSDSSILSGAKPGMLTAGEVNDFNKWKMWEDYNANEFKKHSEFWNMSTDKRYSVQLTDKKFNAVINEPLFLINKATKDTVWKAYTDNTGKAELWAGFLDRQNDNAGYFVSDSYGNKINTPSQFANGVNLLTVDRSCNYSNEVDIAFVVDATGSMGDEIEFLKLELEDVVRSTMEKYKSLTLNAASVFYRDHGDEYVAKKVDFNDDLLKTINFIKLQRAMGGGDTPEAVDDALAMALDSLQWHKNTRTKLLFLVLDAPPHDEAKLRIQQLTVRAAAMGVRIIPIACSGTDKSTEFLLRSMALATNGTYTFLSNHSGIGNKHIEPTTDKYEVEFLNKLLQRIIGQYLYAKDCDVDVAKQTQQLEINQPANVLSIKIYPNPSTGRFTIESNKDIKELFVADFTGKILMRLASDKNKRWRVDMDNYPSGMYLVKYITNDNKWGGEKIVVAR